MKYKSKKPDEFGNCHYTEEENAVWSFLIKRQMPLVLNRACDEYIKGLELLNFSEEKVPQSSEINRILKDLTGWEVSPVPAVIGPTEFYTLLANKKFPMATFIRREEDMDYLQEPDLFHELFGHCPLLTNQAYADFLEFYGKLALSMTEKERLRLFRLFWFTVEFGMLENNKIYGAGILSSKEETIYSVESNVPIKEDLNILTALRTPFRIDIIQPKYFTIKCLNELYQIRDIDLKSIVRKSLEMENLPKLFDKEANIGMDRNSPC